MPSVLRGKGNLGQQRGGKKQKTMFMVPAVEEFLVGPPALHEDEQRDG